MTMTKCQPSDQDIKELKHQLAIRIAKLDVPLRRKDLDKPENVRWLSRNVWINNSKNPHAKEAMRLIARLLRALYNQEK